MFNQLYIDFVKAIFFNNPGTKYSEKDMLKAMPPFYYNPKMMSTAINILLMQKKVIQLPLTGTDDEYIASKDAIANEKYVSELELDKLRTEVIDLDNRLDNYKPSNDRANLAIGISAFVLLVELVRLMIGK